MEKKATPVKTVDQLKEERKASAVARENLKQFNRMKRAIRKALEEGQMTIPDIAKKLEINKADATFYVMSLRKYGIIAAGEQDDMDEYFYYKLKK